MLWVELPRVLADGRTLAVAVWYFTPTHHWALRQGQLRRQMPGLPACGRTGRQRSLQAWSPLVVGDLNARVAAQPDWPGWQECSPPRSTYPSNCPRGGMLLDLRKDMGARLANGRVCGDTEGATTSVGASGAGRAVVATWTM